MQAFVEPEGGGFVSCRSPVFDPPLDLSAYGALELELDGDGRRYKLALACRDGVAGLTELILVVFAGWLSSQRGRVAPPPW